MITKVLKTIEAYQMLSPDSAVVAGVSGGDRFHGASSRFAEPAKGLAGAEGDGGPCKPLPAGSGGGPGMRNT